MLPTYHYPYLQSHVRARTSGARRLAGLLVLACAPCLAMPILSFEYVGSGLTVSPTDLVVIEGLLENIGDWLVAYCSPSYDHRQNNKPTNPRFHEKCKTLSLERTELSRDYSLVEDKLLRII